jgi:hypothetical protein
MGAVPGVKDRAGAEKHVHGRCAVASRQRGTPAGVTTLARVVARVREEATDELYTTLAGLPSAHLVVVPVGARYSDLERWRKDPAKPSRRNLEKALNGFPKRSRETP